MPRRITEARATIIATEAAQDASTHGRFRVQLIDAGWGSSGYYPAEMLAATGPAAFPAGTHMYFDHAGMLEQHDRRGVRSVRDLTAVTTSVAEYNPTTRALEADIQVLAPYRETITELAPHVGLSITGEAVGEAGEAEGRQGIVFSELVAGYSCDFVAHAGRGGRVLALLESAVRHADEGYGLTASDQRDMLRNAVSDAFGGEDIYVWVRDYTDEWVVFERDYSASDGLHQVTYTVTDGQVAFTGDPIEVYVHTQYLPIGTTPPAQPVITPATEESMPEISEAELRELRDRPTAESVQAAEARAVAAEQQAAESGRQVNLLTAAGVARGRIDTAFGAVEGGLPEAISTRVRERVSADLPLTEAGELDVTAFDTQIAEAITAERAFTATLLEQLGVGTPRGLGGGQPPADTTALNEAQTKLTDAFKGLGMSDEAASLAAQGRN